MLDTHIVQIRRLALRLAMRYGFYPEDAEDFSQDMAALFIEKMAEFDPAKASATTWAYPYIRTELRNFRRRQTSKARGGQGLLVDCDDDDLDDLAAVPPRRNRPLKIPTSHLTPAAVSLIEAVLATGSVTEAASNLGVTVQTARSRLRRLKQK
jgi:RNA polymerase sigma factor (sigma-70 family)